MRVNQIMHKELVTISPTSTIHDAALKMKGDGVGSVLVVDEGMKLKGIVTDRDIALAVAADDKDPNKTFINNIMTGEPQIISSDADMENALSVMKRKNIRRLPVIENGKVVGLLSTADLATEIKTEFDNFMGLEEAFAKH
ncbi:MAG: CBS domain-containing protein [Thermodesulfovibrionales bacterium]